MLKKYRDYTSGTLQMSRLQLHKTQNQQSDEA